MYYKLTVWDDEGTSYRNISAKSYEEAQKALDDMKLDFQIDEAAKASIAEITVEDCLSKENEVWNNRIFNRFLKLQYDFDKLTIREYAALQRKYKRDTDFKWQVLKAVNEAEDKKEFIRKICNVERMTVKQFDDAVAELLRVIGSDAYENTVRNLIAAYGKQA